MVEIENLIKVFFSDYTIKSSSENDQLFERNYEVSSNNILRKKDTNVDANSLLSFLKGTDTLIFTITYSNQDPLSFSSSEFDIANFTDELNNENELCNDNEEVSIKLVINKTRINDTISIYDLTTFFETINSRNFFQILTIFNRVLENTKLIKFNVLNLEEEFNTDSMCFISSETTEIKKGESIRFDQIENVKHLSHFTQFSLCPRDFSIIGEPKVSENISNLFKSLSIILSVSYLFDITSVNNNNLSYKLNGYKSINGDLEIKEIRQSEYLEYYRIYDWVYNGGNLIDKIGLARNIISLHLVDTTSILLTGSTFDALKSSYKIYEKENIKQYIDIKTKVSEQLIELSNKATKIAESFGDGFRKSILVTASFYASTIAIKALSKGDFSNIFSIDATVLSLSFILISFIYFLVSRWEIKKQKQRFIIGYNNLKGRYTDLLTSDDINRILNDDIEFNQDLEFINSKIKLFTWAWVSFLIIFFLATIILFTWFSIKQHLSCSFFQVLENILC